MTREFTWRISMAILWQMSNTEEQQIKRKLETLDIGYSNKLFFISESISQEIKACNTVHHNTNTFWSRRWK
jgi:hypothetical protein